MKFTQFQKKNKNNQKYMSISHEMAADGTYLAWKSNRERGEGSASALGSGLGLGVLVRPAG